MHRPGHGAARAWHPDPEDILVTTGGQQAIDLITKILVDPGDPIICEGPTYPGAVPVFTSYQAETIQVGMDHEGMRVDEVEAMIDRPRGRGPAPEVHLLGPELPEPRRA